MSTRIPIGDFLTIGKDMGPGLNEPPRQVIGVVADVRDAGFNQVPMMYIPVAQVSDAMNARNNRLLPITWVVRTAVGTNPAAAVQRELREVSGGRPLEPVRTMHEVVAASSARTEFYIMLLIPFAAIALLLAAVGLYGLMAYSVQQRTQEIGVRMALGAGPEDVRFMVAMQGMRLALLGILIGIPSALALTRIMVSLIFGIPTWDPLVLAAVALLLSAVALCAASIPAIRATRIDPMDALRCVNGSHRSPIAERAWNRAGIRGIHKILPLLGALCIVQGMVSIWFFIGALLLLYGILITGAGLYELSNPPEHPVVHAELHAGIWWGALLLVLGIFYSVKFRPGRS